LESSVFEGEEDDPTKGTTEGTVGKNGGDSDDDEHSPEEAGHESPPPPPPPEEEEDAIETKVTKVTNTMKQTERINTRRKRVEVTKHEAIIIIIVVTKTASK